MSAQPTDGLYYDFHWPLSLKNLVDEQNQARQRQANALVPSQVPPVRQWFSQPRAGGDGTTEVLTASFKAPLAINEISFELLRVPVVVELWYQDRLNNWRQVLDHNRIPVRVALSSSSQASWYKHHTPIYQIVAKALQIRATRVPSPLMSDEPYSIGVRNVLPKRTVYDRHSGRLPFEDELDPIGNVVSKYIKDWDAAKAIDNQPATFWRSAPQPDHQAVVSLYLDYRQPDGSSQMLDGIYIDPVYTGQTLNIYYSNDDTVGTRRVSPITLPPVEDINTDWRADRGRWDTSTSPSGTSTYAFNLAVGPLVNQDAWLGIEWTPDFDPLDGPALNPILLQVTPDNPSANQWWPTIYYDVGAAEMTLSLTKTGGTTTSYSVPLSPLYTPGETLRIVVGWRYDPQQVIISVCTQRGVELARLEDDDPGLPPLITVDGTVEIQNFRGLLTSHIIKLEDYSLGGAEAYQANPRMYVSPDPVVPRENGQTASTTLDNAVYVADWTMQTHGSGGSDESFFESKTWTPIWRDYLTYRGKLFFPQSTSLKYLKLEFTDLTEEPYPVYDSGIQTTYQVFPVQVQQISTRRNLGLLGAIGGVLQLGAQLGLGALGIGSVNWLNPSSVSRAVDAIFGRTVSPITVTPGTPINLSELPKSVTSSLVQENRTEEANPYVYRRDPVDPTRLAGQAIAELTGKQGQAVRYTTDPVANQIANAFTPLINIARNPSALPVQGQDWWVFPGGNYALPATVMNGLTGATQTVLRRRYTTETRVRFMTASVHRYDTRTVRRDAALAYFAGVREVRAMRRTYIDGQDPEAFEFTLYDPTRWTFNNIKQLETGPCTTAGAVYSIENPGFDLSLAHWQHDPAEGWARDPAKGRWHWGSATVVADGTEKNIRSSAFDVVPGAKIKFSCWVWWQDLIVADGEVGVVLGGTTYLDGEKVADVAFDEVSFTDWSTHTYSYHSEEDIEGPMIHDGTGLYVVDPLEALMTDEGDGFFTPIDDHPFLEDDGTGLYDIGEYDIGYTPNWVRLSGTYTVPSGVDSMRVRLGLTEEAVSGRTWFDTVRVISDDAVLGTVYKELITTSTFAKVRCDFRDSGLVRSDAMWARDDPNNTNIDELKLAYYVSTIPDGTATGTWGDSFATWSDKVITWGAARAEVAVSIDPNRIFDGRRVLRLSRAAGTGGAGIKIQQVTNFVPDALARLCVTFLKPVANNNEITLRLRRLTDGVYVYEQTLTAPPVGYWHTFKTQFFEVPDGDDQAYTIEVTAVGDAEEDIFINDLYSELAHVRYFMRLGGAGKFLHDVTSLRYADSAQVVTAQPVNEVSVQAAILTPKAFVYGATIIPSYLK